MIGRGGVVVAGALANKPGNGGEAWVRLAWIRGLQALGVPVFFVERLQHIASSSSTSTGDVGDAPHPGRTFFETVIARFGLTGAAALLGPDGRVITGPDADVVRDAVNAADLLVNISGHLRPGDPLFERVKRRAYVDLDPGFTQFWHARGIGDLGLGRHHVHFTVGENIGRPGCSIPTCGFQWIPLKQPVLLDEWRAEALPRGEPKFTTVASWRGSYGPVEFGGKQYGVKAHEFRKLLSLPSQVKVPLEIALNIHEADGEDRRRLESAGWTIRDPAIVAPDPDSFRDYLRGSTGELSPAQNISVETGSGWFSDRSARYLALGRPVVLQDTGLGQRLPIGEGVLTFRTVDEAAEALNAVMEDPERHGRAARQVAEEHFDARKILSEALDRASGRRGALAGGSPVGANSGVPESPPRGARTGAVVLVSGMIAAVPWQGGASWAVLQYLLGLLRLGYDVHFIEELELPTVDPPTPLERSPQWRYLNAVSRRFGLEGRMNLVDRGTHETAGRTLSDLRTLAREAQILVNLSGSLRDRELIDAVPIRLYVDLDPAFTQLWDTQGIEMGFDGHTHFATVGLSLGTAACRVPTCGVQWIPTLPPVVLDEWPAVGAPPVRDAWTTISHWRGYGSVEWDEGRLGQKAHSFRTLMRLPEESGDRFEVALAIDAGEIEDLRALRSNGWSLLEPSSVARTPDTYRRFVGDSFGEIGVAKEGYVTSRCGWFSDRSAAYLSSGRPVVAQDTGFSGHMQTGAGLLTFQSVTEAAERIEEVRADYGRHAAAARSLAEENLDARLVLVRLLTEVRR